jgi:hypothetical protein
MTQEKRNWISAALAPHDKFTRDAFVSDRQISIATQNDNNAKWPMWVNRVVFDLLQECPVYPPIATDERTWRGVGWCHEEMWPLGWMEVA